MIVQPEKLAVIYPAIDLAIPPIPERSRFYPIAPVGIGTPYVESLTSYTCRLATTHSISFGSLYELLLIPNMNKAYLTTPSHLSPGSTLTGSFRNRIKSINGIGKLAKEWVGTLEAMTLRSDLSYLTLIAVSNVLPYLKLLRTFQAWCPACYEEMLQNKQTIYQPLLWNISAVDMCARHGRSLVNHCSYCNRQLLPLTRRAQLGYCSKCGYWLGEHSDSRVTADALIVGEERAWRLFVANTVGDMLAALSTMSGHFSKKTILESLHACIAISTGGVLTQFAKLIRTNLTTVNGWYLGKIRIPLSSLIRICYCLDLSILDFLQVAEVVRGNRVKVKELPTLIRIVKRLRTTRPFNRVEIEAELTNYLDVVPPISLTQVAKKIEANHRDLYRRFPELCRKISSRYRDYLQDFYRKERTKREDEVKQAVIHLYSQGVYVSPRPIAEYLNKPSYLGRRDVAAIIRNTRELLDSKKKAG